MFKTAADPFKKAYVFQTGAKLVPNWCQTGAKTGGRFWLNGCF